MCVWQHTCMHLVRKGQCVSSLRQFVSLASRVPSATPGDHALKTGHLAFCEVTESPCWELSLPAGLCSRAHTLELSSTGTLAQRWERWFSTCPGGPEHPGAYGKHSRVTTPPPRDPSPPSS